jgi:hypothetical protein
MPPLATNCSAQGLERVHFFPRQLLTDVDMLAEQNYFRQRLRRHNRYLHGWGVVCGCDVEAAPTDERPWLLRACPGYVVTPQGDEVLIDAPVEFDLASDWRQAQSPCARVYPCPPTGRMPAPGREEPVYLAVRYAECDARPVRVHPAGCACDELSCAYSRIRDDFELALLWELPASHRDAAAADEAWCETLSRAEELEEPPPVPPCPSCPDEPWVVLARILLPNATSQAITAERITYQDRRVLYSTSTLHGLVLCRSNI